MKFLELTALTKEGAVLGKLWLHVPYNQPFAIATRDRERGTLLDVAPCNAGATIRVSETPQEIMRQLAQIYPERIELVHSRSNNGEIPATGAAHV